MPYKDPEKRKVAARERMRRWRADNPEKNRELQREAARRKREAGKASPFGPDVHLMLIGDPCSYCGGSSTGIDHIIPRSKGGEDVSDNATACCIGCNKLKADKSLLIFLAHRNGCWEFRRDLDLEPVVPAGG